MPAIEPPKPLVWTPELVNRFWNGLAEAGLDDAMAFGRMAKRSIHWLIARHLAKGGRHLDYGSGGGEVATYLIEKGFPFAVHEPAAERQAKTEAQLSGMPGFLGGPSSEPATYDAVTCFEVIEHVLDEVLEQVFDELAGHVKPGGKVIISTPNQENLALDTVFCPISNHTFHRWQHVRRITPQFLVDAFARRGLTKLVVHQLDYADALFEPYLHMMGFVDRPLAAGEIVPLHVHNLMNDIDCTMGGATRLLYVGIKS